MQKCIWKCRLQISPPNCPGGDLFKNNELIFRENEYAVYKFSTIFFMSQYLVLTAIL